MFGTYLHGLFGADGWRRRFLAGLGLDAAGPGYRDGVVAALDEIADVLERNVDADGLLALARAR